MRQHLYSAIHHCFDMQTVKRTNGKVLTLKSVYAEDEQATSGFCLVGNEQFDVRLEDGSWVEIPDTSRAIMGRPSQGREKRLQAMITPAQWAWLEAQKARFEVKTVSDVVFRLVEELMSK